MKERVGDNGGCEFSTPERPHNGPTLLVVEWKNGVQDVLIRKIGVVALEMAQQQGDDVNVALRWVAPAGMLLQAADYGIQTVFELF